MRRAEMRASESQTCVMIADPPWPHANGSRTNSGKSPKYPLMNLRELADIGPTVASLAGENSVIYIWSTTPHLPGALATMAAWGFTYRSLHVWKKTGIAPGFWARSNAELCLIGERGRPSAPPASLIGTTIIEGARLVGRHSSKPDAIHTTVERLWPTTRKVEIFARDGRPGWECIGGDLGSVLTPTGVHELMSASQ